ncbi:MAG: hypothetical protein CMH49_03875 [Myxococcales bacterium]|nr:hypothetical protein [Myxococcales bacterium]
MCVKLHLQSVFTLLNQAPLLRKRILVMAVSVFAMSACSPPEFEAQKKPAPPKRAYSVKLPPSIDLDSLVPPLKDNSGFFRVDGLIMQSKKFIGQEISISAFVTEVSKCSNKVGDTCAKPQIWIAQDKNELDNRIRVADMKRALLKRFKVGKKYIFTGELSQTSKSGLADSRGILRLKEYKRVK